MNISSLLIGIAIGVLGAFGSGFLKKAGEDLYSWIKAKINPKSGADHPQVVLHLHDDRGDNKSETALPVHFALAAIERLNQVSFDDIEEAILSAPPMRRIPRPFGH